MPITVGIAIRDASIHGSIFSSTWGIAPLQLKMTYKLGQLCFGVGYGNLHGGHL
jgi:hypothetical protein